MLRRCHGLLRRPCAGELWGWMPHPPPQPSSQPGLSRYGGCQHPELEKPGLLPQRPIFGSGYENGSSLGDQDSNPSHRRPADIFIPRWRAGPSAAWDFAVTSGLRLEAIVDSVRDPDAVLCKYEDFKRSHRDTHTQCQQQGISFLPMVVEAVGGGWGKVARGVWSALAKSSALANGELETERSCAIMLRQRLSMTLHRENARACLRRAAH